MVTTLLDNDATRLSDAELDRIAALVAGFQAARGDVVDSFDPAGREEMEASPRPGAGANLKHHSASADNVASRCRQR